MRKVSVALGVALSALLMGVVLWGRDRGPILSPLIEETLESASTVKLQPISVQSQDKSERREPAYAKLHFAFAWVPFQATAQMGYHDPQTQVFYSWKGVVLPSEHVPGFDSWFTGFPLDIRALKVTEVDPPPTYYTPLPDGDFAPGFYDKGFSPRFYRWKGIRLKRDQIPAEAFKKYVLPEGLVKAPIVIDPPQFARK